MNILIGEDEPDTSFVYRKVLEERGHSVTLADNGEDCMELYHDSLKAKRMRVRKSSKHSSTFDVVVLDYMMPKKNGLEVAKNILEWNPDQRIIFASAYVKETLEDSVKHLKQVVELIQKPFEVEILVEHIEDFEISESVKKLSLMIKQIKDTNSPTPKEIRELYKATMMAHKGRTFPGL